MATATTCGHGEVPWLRKGGGGLEPSLLAHKAPFPSTYFSEGHLCVRMGTEKYIRATEKSALFRFP